MNAIKTLRLSIMFVLISFTISHAQSDTNQTYPPSVNLSNSDSIWKFMNANLRYPEDAKNNNIQGTVYIGFTVTAEGDITDIKVKRGICTSLDEEAIRLFKLIPKWKPATQTGKPVAIKLNYPISFELK